MDRLRQVVEKIVVQAVIERQPVGVYEIAAKVSHGFPERSIDEVVGIVVDLTLARGGFLYWSKWP